MTTERHAMTDPLDGFDLENPELPKAVKKHAMTSGGYPYEDKLDKDIYETRMYQLQLQLVLLQAHLASSGERVMIVFEGRDAAGKGGTIKTYLENLNPRYNLIAALPKPNDRERTQWYFQRYVDWLPAAGETVLFDRSWYNRAGVEPVMGFSTPEQTEHFLEEAPEFEKRITNDGIHLFKFWLSIGREMQLKRFHDRRHDPLKIWKLSPIDLEALARWDAYTAARDEMLKRTDCAHAPWTVVRTNDKRRGRINLIQSVLHRMDFPGKDLEAIGEIDRNITLGAQAFLKLNKAD
ncbi:MAG: polyphosphate kinase 2 [Alphaproteobacteria bacterium]|nr:polyphosphate kinase 2 [Alphaproteobacteria bacterium]MBU1562959.1 polyphosphate kinase 2 [Alphaproteobacteria bacterium]MBU2304154.1 polyphosphate kinase 2 [Alphaproteobacteria bacterium]MBU2367475.1 polyphosphate kinase 2 [Alphaproteobacteria bacterium]